MPIKFSHDCVSEDAHDVTLGLKSGEIHLLENLRFSNDEVENNKDFSAKSPSMAIYLLMMLELSQRTCVKCRNN